MSNAKIKWGAYWSCSYPLQMSTVGAADLLERSLQVVDCSLPALAFYRSLSRFVRLYQAACAESPMRERALRCRIPWD